LSKTRHPDGTVVVRTFPVTLLHDATQERHDAAWHQLTFALRGHLEVIIGGNTRRLVPADRAVWIPAGTRHTLVMRAPISMRSLFVARPAVKHAPPLRTIAVTPLVRELIVHITKLGALDRAVPAQARLAGVLLDQLAAAEDIALELPSPIDPRARRFADLVTASPGDPTAPLARKAGASLRTLERCFQNDTGLSLGEWRRRVRLFHALHALQGGASVTEVALDVGYASVSAFSQAFAKQFGASPSKLRRS
jgi:AraC-like DNA-binding protein/quercetin dioxygenase-like cupin family protein